MLRAAAEHGLTVVPRGAAPSWPGARRRRRPTWCSTSPRLDRVVEHAAGDLVVRRPGGRPLADVQQRLPAPASGSRSTRRSPGATVGGALATSDQRPAAAAAGTLRDLLIGVTFVRADGVVAKAGGKVVKNVAGYDLGKLLDRLVRHARRDHRGACPAPPAAGGAARASSARPPTPRRPHRLAAGRARTRRSCRPRSRSTGRPTARGEVGVLLEGIAPRVSRARRDGLRRCSAPAQPRASRSPTAGAGTRWDVAARAGTSATALKLTFAVSAPARGAREPPRRAECAAAPCAARRAPACVYGAMPPGADTGRRVAASSTRLRAVLRRVRRQRRRRSTRRQPSRTPSTSGDRCRPGPDAPGEGRSSTPTAGCRRAAS